MSFLPPSVDPVGSVTQCPHVRRARKWGWLIAGAVLAIAGLIAAVEGTFGVFGSGDGVGEQQASGTIGQLDSGAGARTAVFSGQSGTYTVWLIDGTVVSETLDQRVNATECFIELQGGETARIDGSRQAISVQEGDTATIGWFDAPEGEVRVNCSFTSFGSRRLAGELRVNREFVVTPGKPSLEWQPWVALFGGIGVTIVGSWALRRGLEGKIITDAVERC